MTCFTAGQGVREETMRLLAHVLRKDIDGLDLTSQIEPEVLHPTAEDEWCAFALGFEHQLRFARVCMPTNEIHRHLGTFDRGPRNSELVREISNLACDRAPTATDARLRDSGF